MDLRLGLLCAILWVSASCLAIGMPCPFTRELNAASNETGADVFLCKSLLQRSTFVPSFCVACPYDEETVRAIKAFQAHYALDEDGIFGPETAEILLKYNLADHYQNNGTKPPPGFKYKVVVPVHRSNRSVEMKASLYDENGDLKYTFLTHTHGQNNADGTALNEICGDGSTPTGLSTFDLNSPEDDPKDFGPYPVNRAVEGLEGNAGLVLSNIRNGILLHTGEWANWNPSMEMPNSHGCIHAHPEAIKSVWQILVALGVRVRPNPYGKLPYPYQPQGVLSVYAVDDVALVDA